MSAEQNDVPPAGPGRPDPGAMFTGGQRSGQPPPDRTPSASAPPREPARTPQRPAGAPPGRPGAASTPTGPGRPASGGGAFGRFAIDYVVPFAAGLALTAGFYLLLVRNLPEAGTWGEIRAKLADRGFIPYVCTMILLWHIAHLATRYFVRVRAEYRAIDENLIPAVSEFTGRDVMEMTRRVVASEATKGARILTRRLMLAAEHLRIAVVNVELGDLLRHSAEADRQRIASARALPNFLFWAIPILGFAGTVAGIGAALGESAAAGGGLPVKTTGLGAAFDALIVAVFMTLVALLVRILVGHSESRLLAELDDYLSRNLQARIRTESIDSRMQDIIGDAIARLTHLQEGVQKNQGEIMAGNMETVSGAQKAIHEAIEVMPKLLDNAGVSAAKAIGGTVQEQTEMARQILADLDTKAASIAQNLGTEFNKVTSELAEALRDVTGRLAESFQSARELSQIQASLERNLEELNKIHDLGQNFVEMKETLAALKPVLESLNKPIPLRFTLERTELGIGGEGAGDAGAGGVIAR